MSSFYTLQELSWDSDFFGRGVGKIEIEGVREHAADINTVIAASDFDLLYCFAAAPQDSPELVERLIDGARWVDGKITYLKDIVPSDHADTTNLHPATEICEALYTLSVQAGVYSRFNIDPNFERHYYEELYRKWIEKSVSREIADEVLVFTEEHETLGMITIGTKGDRMDIGLVSVDAAARGRGIAMKLLEGAEQYAARRKFKQIQVVTQQQNLPACRLYEKYGFRKDTLVNIFHIWKSSSLNDPVQ